MKQLLYALLRSRELRLDPHITHYGTLQNRVFKHPPSLLKVETEISADILSTSCTTFGVYGLSNLHRAARCLGHWS